MATATERAPRLPNWVGAGAPLVLLAVLIALFVALDPIGKLREVPPVESVSFERVVLEPGSIEVHVRNDGADPVTVAQILVNDAYTEHSLADRTLERLRTATIEIAYPWEEGLPIDITIITSTGVTISHAIEAAALTPEADASTIGIYALLGVYIGVLPVAIGLLWWPALRRAGRRWITFFLAFTVGLLVFLLVDTLAEGFELAGETAAVLNGLGLLSLGAIVAVLALTSLEGYLGSKRDATGAPLRLAYLVATGIGLHNMGEGLAVGAALAAGEVALGTFLILGFAIHNTTEGLAIVAPLSKAEHRPSLWHLVALGAVAGVPTIFGAWLGGFAFVPAFATFAFGLAAGAIAQVVWVIGRSMNSGKDLAAGIGAAGFVAGLAVMYATGLFTA